MTRAIPVVLSSIEFSLFLPKQIASGEVLRHSILIDSAQCSLPNSFVNLDQTEVMRLQFNWDSDDLLGLTRICSFYPRPREGGDVPEGNIIGSGEVSIHAPARGRHS